MADKKGKDKTRKNEVRRSLKSKTFFITLLLAMGIGAAVLVMGFMLYLVGVVREYYVNTWNQANSEAAVLEQTNYKDICDEIIRIYDSMTPEERGDGKSPEYIAKYDSVLGEDFTNVQLSMHSLQDRNGPLNAFIVAMDPVDNRMIYMIDADMAEATTCRPGTWDDYPHDQIMKLITETDVMAGKEDSRSIKTVQAVYTNREGFGPRITAGATLFSTDNYKVLICVDEKLDTLIKNSVNFPNVEMPRSGASRICVLHANVPAVITKVTAAISDEGLNIENMTNKSKGDNAYTMVDISSAPSDAAINHIVSLEGIYRVRVV